MVAGTKKPSRSRSSDRISRLPDSILENLLTYLPLQEAVRTSTLSSRWRYLWTNLPQLVFNDSFSNQSLTEGDNSKLMLIIYGVVLTRQRSILKFELSLSSLKSCPEIDRLIHFLSVKGVRDLSIEFWRGETYILPSSIFSCVQMEHLNLQNCIVRSAPDFQGFRMLISLNLCRVSVSSGDFLSNFISSCALLERLTLEDLEYYHLDIVAPKLKFFKFVGFFWSIALKSTTRLEELSIHMLLRIPRTEDEDGRSAPTIFFDNLSVIKLLKLNGGAMKHIFMDGVPDSLSKVLLDLEAIYLYEIFSRLNIGTINVLSLLKSFPNLEKITILVGDLEMETELQDSEESDLYLNRLREVKMVCVGGAQPELMLIKILLARSPKLERMFIESDPEFVKDGGLMILKALAHFRRASPMAQITFDEDQV